MGVLKVSVTNPDTERRLSETFSLSNSNVHDFRRNRTNRPGKYYQGTERTFTKAWDVFSLQKFVFTSSASAGFSGSSPQQAFCFFLHFFFGGGGGGGMDFFNVAIFIFTRRHNLINWNRTQTTFFFPQSFSITFRIIFRRKHSQAQI